MICSTTLTSLGGLFCDTMSEKFWLEDPAALFSSFSILPQDGMTQNQKLNALTRLSLILSLILFGCGCGYAIYFLIGSLVVIVILKYAFHSQPFVSLNKSVNKSHNKSSRKDHHTGLCKNCGSHMKREVDEVLTDYEKDYEDNKISHNTSILESRGSTTSTMATTPIDLLLSSVNDDRWWDGDPSRWLVPSQSDPMNVAEILPPPENYSTRRGPPSRAEYARDASVMNLSATMAGYPSGDNYSSTTNIITIPNNLLPSDQNYINSGGIDHRDYARNSILEHEALSRKTLKNRYQKVLCNRGLLGKR